MAPSASPDGEFVEFTVDAALLKELGERLVGKPHVALAELVKNAYDADATRVRITFEKDAIEVVDNGDGMTSRQFKDFWMRVGTTHKQDMPVTSLKRTVSGSKGVGRLSVQFLGNALDLWSISRNGRRTALRAEVDWSKAQRAKSLVKSGAMVYQVAATEALPQGFAHGTRIRIKGLNQQWGAEELRGLARELWFLRPPKHVAQDLATKEKFEIELEGAAAAEQAAFNTQLDKAFSSWIAEIKGSIKRGRKGGLAEVTVTFEDGHSETQKYKLPEGQLDQASFSVRVYKLSGKQAGGIPVKEAREYFHKFGGVHVYDQTFRLPFYGGTGEDWLRLETDHSHRLILSKLVPESLRGDGDLRDLPTNGRIFGIVRVATSHERKVAPASARARGEYLNVQVTRDRFIDNGAMADLRALVRWGMDFYAYLSSARRYKKTFASGVKAVPPSDPVFEEIRQRISDLRSNVSPRAAVQLEHINTGVEKLLDIEKQRVERSHRERVLLGALATAGMGAIALEHELGKELTALRKAVNRLSGSSDSASDKVKESLEALIQRITDARKLMSPLMEPENRDHESRLKAKLLVESIVDDLKPLLRGVRIDTSAIDDDLRLPSATRAAWAAILQNVIVNAVNATIESSPKLIRIVGQSVASGKKASLRVEDNGVGVELDEAETLFEPFERRLELSSDRKRLGLGGVGLGLTIVRMVADSVDCKVEFVEPSENMSTAIELSWKASDEPSTASNIDRRRRN